MLGCGVAAAEADVLAREDAVDDGVEALGKQVPKPVWQPEPQYDMFAPPNKLLVRNGGLIRQGFSRGNPQYPLSLQQLP